MRYNMINKLLDISKIIVTMVVLIILSFFICIDLQIGPSIVDATPFYISDTVYGSSWNAVINKSPTFNAIYDYLHQIDTDDDGDVDNIESTARELNDLSDPSATTTFIMAGHELTFGSVTDQWGGLTISNSNADVTGETKLLTLISAETNDVNLTFFDIQDAGGSIFKLAGTATGSQLTGDFEMVISDIDSATMTTQTDFETTGVRVTASNGSITFLGLGSGQDEDLKLDFDTTVNTIEVTSPASGATAIDFNTLNLLTTGTIRGSINVITDADGIALTAAQMNSYLIMTGAGEVTLPDVCDSATGAWVKVKARDASEQVEMVVTDTSDLWVLSDGTETTANDEADLATPAGSWAVFVCLETNKWYVDGENGTVTDGGVPD
jgi:hypothetical protein